MSRTVAIRFGTEGRAQVVADLEAIGRSGDAAANRYARGFERASRDVEVALERQQRAASKLEALMPGLNPTKLDSYAGVRDNVGKSAESSAAVFTAAYDQMERKAEALRAAIDPVYAAQRRFDAEMENARTLLAAGAIETEHYTTKLQQEEGALDAVRRAHSGAAGTSDKMRMAMSGASYQVQDLVTQISMGANPIQALTVQGGQLAGQFQHVEGTAGSVARFFMGGWGIALQVGLAVLAPFVAKLWEEDEAAQAAKEAADEHRKAVLDLAAAQERAIQTAERKQALDVASIKIEYDAAIATRERTRATLDNAIAQERANRDRAQGPGTRGELGALAAVGNDSGRLGQIAALEAQLASNTATVNDLRRKGAIGFNRMIGIKQEANSTPEGRVQRQFGLSMEAAYGLAPAAFAAKQREAIAVRDRELAAIQASTAARTKDAVANRQTGRSINVDDARSIVESIGGHVTSDVRSRAEQEVLYARYLSGKGALPAKPGSSNHERGLALDIRKSPGMSLAKIRAAFGEKGVAITELLDEGSHFHVAWKRAAGAVDTYAVAQRAATKEAHDFAEAQRQLDSDLSSIVGALDPARASAAAYAETLDKIDKLLGAGKLTGSEAFEYRLTAFRKRQEQETGDLSAKFKATFGGDDPLGEMVAAGDAALKEQLDGERQLQQFRRDNLQSLGDFYLDIFNNGTGSIWGMFRSYGLKVLSELLAKWTMGENGKGVGSVLGSVFGLFGSGTGGVDADAFRAANLAGLPAIGKNAAGTEYWSGGMSLVGEHGAEIVSMPRGSRVSTAGETRRLLAGNDNLRPINNVTINANDAVLAETVRAWVAQGMQVAAMQGAAGGAVMGQAEMTAGSRRKLGRNWG